MAKFNITILFVLAFALMASDSKDEPVNFISCSDLELSLSVEKLGSGFSAISASLSFRDEGDDHQGNDDQDFGDDAGDEKGKDNLEGSPYENAKFHYIFYDVEGNLLSLQFENRTVRDLSPGTYYCTIVGPEGCKLKESVVIK